MNGTSRPVSSVSDTLADVTPLGFDTSAFISYVERHPVFFPAAQAVFVQITAATIAGYTSVITLTEVLTQPLRRGNAHLVREYRDLFATSDNLTLVPVHAVIAERAADLRARYRLRTPDALHVATALHQRCDAFLTNDATLRRVAELRVLLLSDLAAT